MKIHILCMYLMDYIDCNYSLSILRCYLDDYYNNYYTHLVDNHLMLNHDNYMDNINSIEQEDLDNDNYYMQNN